MVFRWHKRPACVPNAGRLNLFLTQRLLPHLLQHTIQIPPHNLCPRVLLTQKLSKNRKRPLVTLLRASQIAEVLEHPAEVVDSRRHFWMVWSVNRFVNDNGPLIAFLRACQIANGLEHHAEVVDIPSRHLDGSAHRLPRQ